MTTDQKPWRAEMPPKVLTWYTVGPAFEGFHHSDVEKIVAKCNIELDASLARIAELEAAQQWRPMETAPTFVADVDGFVRDAPVLLAFPTGHVTIAERGPRKSSKWRHHSTGSGFTCEPIAWLPLPEPPKEGKRP